MVQFFEQLFTTRRYDMKKYMVNTTAFSAAALACAVFFPVAALAELPHSCQEYLSWACDHWDKTHTPAYQKHDRCFSDPSDARAALDAYSHWHRLPSEIVEECVPGKAAKSSGKKPVFSAELERDNLNYCNLYVTNHERRQITCHAFGATFHISPKSREMGYGVPSGGPNASCPTNVPVSCEFFKDIVN